MKLLLVLRPEDENSTRRKNAKKMPYYKILNEKEFHDGLQLKLGLNIAPEGSKGICFSQEDILYFLDQGTWIRKVTLPEDAQVHEEPGDIMAWRSNKVILSGKEQITTRVIKQLIKEGADPSVGFFFPIKWAIKHNHFNITKLLLPLHDSYDFSGTLLKAIYNNYIKMVKILIPYVSKIKNSEILIIAAEKGYTKIVEMLIPYSDPKTNNSEALRIAAEKGYTKIVEMLIPYSDPGAEYHRSFRFAARYGHLDIVKLLLPFSNPKNYDSEALRGAAHNGHLEVVKFLIPLSQPYKNDSAALVAAACNGHLEVVEALLPVSEINDNVKYICNKYCKYRKIRKLIRSIQTKKNKMSYYKILNKEECHNGLQYKTGLNIDPLRFNPYGECEPGGIYFSREDILAFLFHGPWIRKVTLPEDAQVYKEPGNSRNWKADKVILGKREKITAKVIKRLIAEGADPQACENYPLDWAAHNGHLEIVKVLLPYSDPKANDSRPLRSAVIKKHIEIVKVLLPYSKINDVINYCAEYRRNQEIHDLIKASKKGNLNGLL